MEAVEFARSPLSSPRNLKYKKDCDYKITTRTRKITVKLCILGKFGCQFRIGLKVSNNPPTLFFIYPPLIFGFTCALLRWLVFTQIPLEIASHPLRILNQN
jgi:hypothetical protein